jgi:hypothetical protein
VQASDLIELVALVFFAGAFWQRTGTLNETLKEMKVSFDKSIGALTDRVNNHSERISRIEGRVEVE